MPADRFKPDTQRLTCHGLNVNSSVDNVPPTKFPRLQNVRSYSQGHIEPRYGLTLAGSAASTPWHSIRRLNDNLDWGHIGGAGADLLYRRQLNAFAIVDTGYSTDPLSLVPDTPIESRAPWMYVSDKQRMRKVSLDGDVHLIGLPAPKLPPAVKLANGPYYKEVNYNEATTNWAQTGTAGAPALISHRVSTTISQIVYDDSTIYNDPAAIGWASVEPAAATNILPGVHLVTTTNQAAETVIVQSVHPANTKVAINSIIYDDPVTSIGGCSIQLVTRLPLLDTNSLVRIENAAGTTAEICRVESVTPALDGSTSIRVTTRNVAANPFVATDTVTGLATFRAYFTANHIIGSTLVVHGITSSVTTGTGYLTCTAAKDLSIIATNIPALPDDKIHVSINVDLPDKVTEGKILFDVDAATNDFTKNYFWVAFRPSDLTPAFTTAASVLATRATADTNAGTDEPIVDTHVVYNDGPPDSRQYGLPRPYNFNENPYYDQAGAGPPSTTGSNDIPTTFVSKQMGTGVSQWVELVFSVNDFNRVGTDVTRTWAHVAKFRLEITVTATVVVGTTSWWLGGGFGPDVDASRNDSPYFYRYRSRCAHTGVRSNYSPAHRGGVYPKRQAVVVTMPTALLALPPEVTTFDIERWGGQLQNWNYVGSISTLGVFTDKLPDDIAAVNGSEGQTNFQPFPTAQWNASGQCTVAGTSVQDNGVGPSTFNTEWCPGNVIEVGGHYYTIYRVISTSLLEIVESAGAEPTGTLAWNVTEPIIAGQPLPILFGPFENFMFGLGDPNNAGVLYFCNGNNPDGTRQEYKIQVCSNSEPLMNGCVFNGRAFVWSSQRMFQILPSFGSTEMFVVRDLPNSKGLYARYALTGCNGTEYPRMWYLSRDGIEETSGGESVSITDEDLFPLFPHEGNIGLESNGYQPPSTNFDPKQLRLSYADDFIYFDYKDVNGTRATLAYHRDAKAWYADVYADPLVFHYLEEGETVHSIMAGGSAAAASLYQCTGTTDAGTDIACIVRTPSLNEGTPRNYKYYGDYMVDADTHGAALTITPGFNKHVTTLAPVTLISTVRAATGFDLNGGLGQLAWDMSLEFTFPANALRPELFVWEPWFIVYPETSAKRATDFDDSGYVGCKWLQGIVIEADTAGANRSVQVLGDNDEVLTTLTINHNGRVQQPYSWAGRFTHQMRLLPTDVTLWRLFTWRWVYEPAPEATTVWETPDTTHNLPGYQHLRDGYIAHVSYTNIILTVTVDGTQYVYNIPHGNSLYKKSYLPFKAIKGKAYRYKLESWCPFRLYQQDCEVRCGPWGRTDAYQTLRPFGDLSMINGARI